MPADWYELTEDELYGNPWEQLREPERFDPLAAPLDTVTDWPDDWALWPNEGEAS